MPEVPVLLPASQIIRALKRAGFSEDRQRGSHLVLIHAASGRRTVIPVHGGRDIKKPLLRKILAEAGIALDEFLKLL